MRMFCWGECMKILLKCDGCRSFILLQSTGAKNIWCNLIPSGNSSCHNSNGKLDRFRIHRHDYGISSFWNWKISEECKYSNKPKIPHHSFWIQHFIYAHFIYVYVLFPFNFSQKRVVSYLVSTFFHFFDCLWQRCHFLKLQRFLNCMTWKCEKEKRIWKTSRGFFLPCFLKEEDIFVEPAFLGIQILKNFEALRYDRLALKKEVGFHA